MNVSKNEHFLVRRPVHKKRVLFPSARICMGVECVTLFMRCGGFTSIIQLLSHKAVSWKIFSAAGDLS